MSNIVTANLTVGFEITRGLRKKVANALDISTSQLPVDDREFILLVLSQLDVTFCIIDSITSEKIDITPYVAEAAEPVADTLVTRIEADDSSDTQPIIVVPVIK